MCPDNFVTYVSGLSRRQSSVVSRQSSVVSRQSSVVSPEVESRYTRSEKAGGGRKIAALFLSRILRNERKTINTENTELTEIVRSQSHERRLTLLETTAC